MAPQASTQENPAAELLSEHCFAGKCSTSHVLDPGAVWERFCCTRTAPEAVSAAAPVTTIRQQVFHVRPAVNRQPGYRRGTRRAFSKRTAGKSASLSNPQKIATTSARLETQTQSKSSKQSGNEQPASCHQKLARDTRKQTKQGKPNQLPANLKAQRRPATRSTQQPNAQNQQPDQ